MIWCKKYWNRNYLIWWFSLIFPRRYLNNWNICCFLHYVEIWNDFLWVQTEYWTVLSHLENSRSEIRMRIFISKSYIKHKSFRRSCFKKSYKRTLQALFWAKNDRTSRSINMWVSNTPQKRDSYFLFSDWATSSIETVI